MIAWLVTRVYVTYKNVVLSLRDINALLPSSSCLRQALPSVRSSLPSLSDLRGVASTASAESVFVFS